MPSRQKNRPHVFQKEDSFLEGANFSRDEIISGMEDAMKVVELEILICLKTEKKTHGVEKRSSRVITFSKIQAYSFLLTPKADTSV